MKHAKKTSPVGFYAVLAATAVVFLLIIVLVIVFVSSSTDGDDVGTTAPSQVESTVTEAPESTKPESKPVTAAPVTTPAVTTVVTTAETTTTAQTTTASTTPPPVQTTAPVNPIPGDRNTDFTGCLFIGDSRTQGLMMYSGVKGATAYASRGLTVDSFFSAPAVDMGGAKVSASEAVTKNTGFSHVFIMFGVNELGWPYADVFGDRYAKVIDHVKAAMPNAKIIVQSIIPVTATKSANDDVYNNERIELFNSKIRDMCAQKGVTYFDLVPVLGTDGGALPADAAFDGVHLQKSYCEKWLDSLRGAL